MELRLFSSSVSLDRHYSYGGTLTFYFLPPVYVSYLVFQLFSHKSLYDDKSGQKPATIKYAPRTGPSTKEKTRKFFGLSPVKETKEDGLSADSDSHTVQPDDDVRRVVDEEQPGPTEPEEEDEEVPELSLPMTIGLLFFVTVLVAVTAEWLVDSIDGLASGGGISKEFIGLILLPIVGNAAEHATAVTVSVKDKLTLSLGVAVGSSIVSPFIPQLRRQKPVTRSTHSAPANRAVCHPVHRHLGVDHRPSDHHALRPVRIDRALFLSTDRQLRRARWKVKLVRRNDPDLPVRLNPPFLPCVSFRFSHTPCWNTGTS